ncbi:hypothetical protein [Pseudomonas aeruginosa]|uniref:hypothetical protein n=1 Tax=Pseudomonas aeruginosa TaxID=287 RepID=UPI00141AD6F3|nr:hypothetical protein [Pseudomonas aeruginosa]
MKAPIGESYRLLPLQLRDPCQGGVALFTHFIPVREALLCLLCPRIAIRSQLPDDAVVLFE